MTLSHNEILTQLDGRIVLVREQKYNSTIKDYEEVILHYRLVLQKNFNWNWLTRSNEETGKKSLKAVKVENPAVQFDTYLISHANDFAYNFGLIDENHKISERSGKILSAIDFYKPQPPHINQNCLILPLLPIAAPASP